MESVLHVVPQKRLVAGRFKRAHAQHAIIIILIINPRGLKIPGGDLARDSLSSAMDQIAFA